MKIVKYWDDFFDWVKGAELVELNEVNTKDDPVRPELDNKFRTSSGRKIYGLMDKKEDIEGVACVAFTNEIPTTVKELELMSKEADMISAHRAGQVGSTAVAYTLWSLKRGAGKKLMKELQTYIKSLPHIQQLVTLSPLTPVATHYHIRNGAKLISINPTTQNFEYKI